MYTPAAVDFRNHAVPVPVDDYIPTTYILYVYSVRVTCHCEHTHIIIIYD